MTGLQTALKKTLNTPVTVIARDNKQVQYDCPSCGKKHTNVLDILSCSCEKRNKAV